MDETRLWVSKRVAFSLTCLPSLAAASDRINPRALAPGRHVGTLSAAVILTQNILTQNILTQNILTQNIPTQNIPTQNIPTQNILTQNILTQNILTQNILTQNILTQSILTQNILTQNILTQAFADALLIIPKTLAENSGYDAQDSLMKLQEAHMAGSAAVCRRET